VSALTAVCHCCVALQFNGTHISWLRYAEWLLTCPVSS
jgi:bacteriorhodopsin